ncbi:MAG: hypothetical protein AWU54_492 [Candidatus Frackibacter sp. T328-2]|nr:MAG: hypothetical protein AWU54_492 [Candidatus Frackibacter sp. T328-2]
MQLINKLSVLVKNNWSYWLGGLLLAILNILIFVLTDEPWGITTTFALIGASGMKFLGVDIVQWSYIRDILQGKDIINYLLTYRGTILDLGIIIGSLLSILLSMQFRFRKIHKWKRAISALIGGILMGYGARIAGGCNIGAMVTGIASMSIHGWIFGIFLLVGVYIGGKYIKAVML